MCSICASSRFRTCFDCTARRYTVQGHRLFFATDTARPRHGHQSYPEQMHAAVTSRYRTDRTKVSRRADVTSTSVSSFPGVLQEMPLRTCAAVDKRARRLLHPNWVRCSFQFIRARASAKRLSAPRRAGDNRSAGRHGHMIREALNT